MLDCLLPLPILSLYSVFRQQNGNETRSLERLSEWLDLVALVVPAMLNENKDKFLWRLGKNGPFSTQSLYKEIVKPEKAGGKDLFWKAKLPLKIKIPLWYLIKKGVLLRKDNLLKRGWKEDVTVVFLVLKR